MSGEIVQFLLTKFTRSLEDVKKDYHQVPLRKSFERIALLLSERVAPSMPNSIRDALMDCLYTLNDAFTECRVLFENRKRRHLPHYTVKEAYLLYRIRRDLSRIKQWIQTVDEVNVSMPIVESHDEAHSPEITETPGVYGLDIEKEKIITSLQQECDTDNGINTVGIVGMGGSGKTTLAQLVYHDKRVKREFIPRIWVPVTSKSEFIKDIVEYLLKELGDDDDDGETHECHEQVTEEENEVLNKLLAALYKQLDGKKYLIVIDDVWHIDRWYGQLVNSPPMDHLGLPKGYGGGIIISSRLQDDVGEMVGKANLHHPPSLLADDHCWSIFKDVLQENGIEVADHLNLTTMQSEIIANCNGLPLAAKTLGGVISKKIHDGELCRRELKNGASRGVTAVSYGLTTLHDELQRP